ncbi:hypothetical protein Tco_1210391 [Tanacetum coccineum]
MKIAIQAEEGEGSRHPSEPQPPPSTDQPTNEELTPLTVVVPGAKKPYGVPLLRLGLRGYLHSPMIHLSQEKVESLEADLKQTKKVYGVAYNKLIKKVKKLEKTVKSNQVRRRATIVVSDDEEDLEASSKQGRMIEEIDQDARVTLEEEGGTNYSADEWKKYWLVGLFSTLATESILVTALQSMLVSTARLRELTNQQQEQESTEEEWENIRARVKDDEELSRRLQAEERNKYNEVDQEKMHHRILEGRASELAAGSSQATIIDSTEVESSKKNAEVELYHEGRGKRQMKLQDQFKNNRKERGKRIITRGFTIQMMMDLQLKESRKYWRVIKLVISTEAYQFFEDMLKIFDRDDLVMLWNLVKERFSSTEPTDDKERALWVELKRLFEPNTDDTLWKLQRYIADYEIENI